MQTSAETKVMNLVENKALKERDKLQISTLGIGEHNRLCINIIYKITQD
jgi:hypothetical protein